ncbi:hypothetical protein ACFVZ3_39225 [Kitasatospora purpeofusca]|uniref:hypothetical protein n=1 Tax=Kitasatospora purpeofusca TaxID=67352 RepID=UPI003696FE5A
MSATDARAMETVARRHLDEVHTVESETRRLAFYLGFDTELDRILLRSDPHPTMPVSAVLRRLLVVVSDLLEQTGAALFAVHLARPMPGLTAELLMAGVDGVLEIVRDAHRAVCARVDSSALHALDTAVTTMRQIAQMVMGSPLLAAHRAAADAGRQPAGGAQAH